MEPRGYERDGFEVPLWTYYEPVKPQVSAVEYANALERLHAGMRMIDVPTPHFTERVADAPEQLLHGEPHRGNVLSTKLGPLFIDPETCCRGPVEFDLAHVPAAVSEHYPDADQLLVRDCRGFVLAVVAKHRCDPGDQFPNGQRALRDLLGALRSGPPWPPLDVVMRESASAYSEPIST